VPTKGTTLNITLPDELSERLNNMARRAKRSRKDIAIRALELFFVIDEERSDFMRKNNADRVKTRVHFEAEDDKSLAAVLLY